MNDFMSKRRIISGRSLEAMKLRHLNEVALDIVKGFNSPGSNIGSNVSEKSLCDLTPLVFAQAGTLREIYSINLSGIENGKPSGKESSTTRRRTFIIFSVILAS